MGIETQKQQSSVAEAVEQLVAVNPYNPDILPDLENYVNEQLNQRIFGFFHFASVNVNPITVVCHNQVSSQTYSLDANLCLLRLYQFEPERLSTQIVARILVKALMAMPAPDFSLCLFLIPERVVLCLNPAGNSLSHLVSWILRALRFTMVGEANMGLPDQCGFCGMNQEGDVPNVRNFLEFLNAIEDFATIIFYHFSREKISRFVQMEEQFKTLIVLSHYLETARFRQFWDEAAKSRHIVEAVPGFEHAIQAYALHVLTLSYQKVPRSVLAESINIEGLSLDKFLEHQATNSGWILEKGQGRGQLIILPQNEFNHPELKKSTADSIPLDHITRIFPILS
ncbi:hypothetical protein RHGRI_012852 [Rhododendron griersonianum]|uniref:Eukaryotic translation initiation factor 3 subunit K n=1 Tax=Rhododendron griersonianum TaxID=479676 RepID=A0AAV6K3Q3_9ERIC|nr:hypothetical protein RHGRI_012852 [Rhododendron griersonianum]